MNRKVDFRLYLITDRRLTSDLAFTVEGALRAGVKAFQIREKDLSARELIGLAERLHGIAKKYGAMTFINDRIDIALGLGLEGVHLGQSSLPVSVAKKIAGDKLPIGVSTHSLDEAIEAQEDGADFITFGPVFETPSKINYGPPKGIQALREVVSRVKIPVFGIGGINMKNIHEVLDTGAHGIALISAIMASERPEDAARSLMEQIQRRAP